jgi:hypothetical protein
MNFTAFILKFYTPQYFTDKKPFEPRGFKRLLRLVMYYFLGTNHNFSSTKSIVKTHCLRIDEP